MRRSCLADGFGSALATLVGTACLHAQYPIETLTFSIEWDQPVIAPGQTNTGAIYATLGPEIGTITAWNSKPGNGEPGILMAFASTIFNFTGLQNSTEGKLAWTTASEFTTAGIPPTSDGKEGFFAASLGQFGMPVNTSPNIKQKVKLVDVSWTASLSPLPSEPYEVLYATKASSAKVFLEVGLIAWVGENAVKVDGQGGFAVTPAPATLALALPLALTTRRKRRQP